VDLVDDWYTFYGALICFTILSFGLINTLLCENGHDLEMTHPTNSLFSIVKKLAQRRAKVNNLFKGNKLKLKQ
jgi:hypothetical protein